MKPELVRIFLGCLLLPGVVFTTLPWRIVLALDAKTGKLLWQFCKWGQIYFPDVSENKSVPDELSFPNLEVQHDCHDHAEHRR